MSCEAVDGDHPDPPVHRVELIGGGTFHEVAFEGADFAQGVAMEEDEQLVGEGLPVAIVNLCQTSFDPFESRRCQPCPRQNRTQRIGVAAVRDASEECRLDRRRDRKSVV